MDRSQYDQIIQKTGDEVGPYAAVQVAKIIRSVVAPGKPPSTLRPGQAPYAEVAQGRLALPVPTRPSKGARRFARRVAARG